MSRNFEYLTEEQNILLALLKNSLFGKAEKISFEKSDYYNLWNEALVQTVVLIAMNDFETVSLSDEEKALVKSKLQSFFLKNISVGTEHCHLHSLLSDADIPYVIIKGMASSVYYPDELMRLLGDVDFLIREEDMAAVDKILCNDGYVARKKENSHHVTYDKDGLRCEMHFMPPGIPTGSAGDIVSEFFNDIIEKSHVIDTSLGKMSVPSVYHHGLIILLHAIHHLTGDGLGLRHLCDWAVFISSLTKEEFCSVFENSLKSAGLWKIAVILTSVCAEYLGAPFVIYDESLDNELCKKLICDIFSSGNFGQKNADRSHESLFIADKKKDNKKHGLIRNAILAVNEIVYSHWRIARRIRLLLPLGWIFFGGRYIIRSLAGKRPEIRLKNVLNEAYERQKFYDDLELFKNG